MSSITIIHFSSDLMMASEWQPLSQPLMTIIRSRRTRQSVRSSLSSNRGIQSLGHHSCLLSWSIVLALMLTLKEKAHSGLFTKSTTPIRAIVRRWSVSMSHIRFGATTTQRSPKTWWLSLKLATELSQTTIARVRQRLTNGWRKSTFSRMKMRKGTLNQNAIMKNVSHNTLSSGSKLYLQMLERIFLVSQLFRESNSTSTFWASMSLNRKRLFSKI